MSSKICNFFYFDFFKPYPPPRGCILVYKKSQCCPYLSCSKYHINYYKNSESNHGENFNQLQGNHEKTLEKNSRLESDGEDEMNGGKRRKKLRNVNKEHDNKTLFQVVSKADRFMRPVSEQTQIIRIFL